MSDARVYNHRTADEFEAMRKMYLEEGMSATEIARKRGQGETRNQIIGVISRKGWKRSGMVAMTVAPKKVQHHTKVGKLPRVDQAEHRPPTPIEVDETGTGPTLLELALNQCRSPVGPDTRVSGRPQMFCGALVGTRTVEIAKGRYIERLDSYCPGCGARNRSANQPTLQTRQRLERMAKGSA